MQCLPRARNRRFCKVTTALMTDYFGQGGAFGPHDRMSRAAAPVGDSPQGSPKPTGVRAAVASKAGDEGLCGKRGLSREDL